MRAIGHVSVQRLAPSDGFEHGRQALADADAHGRNAEPAAAAAQLAEKGGGEAGAGAAEWVAEGDRAAVDVEALLVEPELSGAGEDLGGEGLVELDQVDLVDREARGGKGARDRLDRADAHVCGVVPGEFGGEDPGTLLGTEPLDAGRGGD